MSSTLQRRWYFQNAKCVVTCPLTLIPHPHSTALRIETRRSGSQPQGPLVVDSFRLFHYNAFAHVFSSARNALMSLCTKLTLQEISSTITCSRRPSLALWQALGSLMGPLPSHTLEVMLYLFMRFFASSVCIHQLCVHENGFMLSPGQCLAHSTGSLNTLEVENPVMWWGWGEEERRVLEADTRPAERGDNLLFACYLFS